MRKSCYTKRRMPSRFFQPLVDLVFPLFCYICGAEGHTWCRPDQQKLPWPLCFACRRGYHPHDSQPGCPVSQPLIWLGPYHDLRLRTALYQWKYSGYWQISQDWAASLAKQLQTHFSEKGLLVPIPLHWRRRLARGYNQTAILTNQISRLSTWPRADLLIRTRTTAVQAKLKTDERVANVAGAFAIASKVDAIFPDKKPVWLIDDVATTGATLAEAQGVLQRVDWTVAGIIVVAATGMATSQIFSTNPNHQE